MRNLIAAIPQGMIWYPIILVVFAGAIATLWRLFRKPHRRRRSFEVQVEHMESIAQLIRRGRTDTMASLDLERRTLALLLQHHGFSGYSAAHCRAYLDSGPPEQVGALVQAHLSEIHTEPASRHIPYRNGLPERVTSLLEHIEEELEV